MAHNEPPHLDLHYLLSSLKVLNSIAWTYLFFSKFADVNFVVCFFALKELICMGRLETINVYTTNKSLFRLVDCMNHKKVPDCFFFFFFFFFHFKYFIKESFQ